MGLICGQIIFPIIKRMALWLIKGWGLKNVNYSNNILLITGKGMSPFSGGKIILYILSFIQDVKSILNNPNAEMDIHSTKTFD
jgi:hypothetical protein